MSPSHVTIVEPFKRPVLASYPKSPKPLVQLQTDADLWAQAMHAPSSLGLYNPLPTPPQSRSSLSQPVPLPPVPQLDRVLPQQLTSYKLCVPSILEGVVGQLRRDHALVPKVLKRSGMEVQECYTAENLRALPQRRFRGVTLESLAARRQWLQQQLNAETMLYGRVDTDVRPEAIMGDGANYSFCAPQNFLPLAPVMQALASLAFFVNWPDVAIDHRVLPAYLGRKPNDDDKRQLRLMIAIKHTDCFVAMALADADKSKHKSFLLRLIGDEYHFRSLPTPMPKLTFTGLADDGITPFSWY